MVPFMLASYAVERLWPAGSLLAFFLQVAAIFPVALAGIWLVGLEPSERASYSLPLTRRFRPLRERS
jgi:hypothetical protein